MRQNHSVGTEKLYVIALFEAFHILAKYKANTIKFLPVFEIILIAQLVLQWHACITGKCIKGIKAWQAKLKNLRKGFYFMGNQ